MATQERAIRLLAEVGSEESLIQITEYVLDCVSFLPWLLFRRGSDPVAGNPFFDYMEDLNNDTPNIPAGVFKALRTIREKTRARTAKLYYLKDRNGRERTLVHFALTVILSIVPGEALPDFVRNAEFIKTFGQRFGVPACETEELREALGAKRDAIEVLTREISSKDTSCRDGAIFGLALCGVDAAAAVPALKAVLANPDELVSKLAAEALKKIQGDYHEP